MEQVTRQISRHPFKIGQRIAGRYVVRSFLGCGSMGWVLKVSDDELNGEPVALKVLYPHLSGDSNSIARFHAEVVTARKLSHPSIIHVHDLSEGIDSGMFIAMEFIDGMSLAEVLAKTEGRGLPFDEGLLILTRIAEGLLYAHEHGIVHRDLKPANILVGRDGAVKIGDFGLAKSFQQEFGLTRTGETLGTPLYMAPEQFESGAIDQRTDIYAFGILAFEVLTGRPPFKDAGFFELARQHIEDPLPPLGNEVGPLPAWCAEIIAKCAAKLPSERPLSIAEFLPQLQEAIPAFTRLRNATKPKRRKFGLRRPTSLRALAVPAFFATMILYQTTYSFEGYRSMCAGYIFALEHDFKFEMTLVRALWGYKGSLLHPESAFDLVNPEDAVHLRTLFTAYSKVASSGKRLPNVVHQRDAQGSTLLHRAVEQDSRELIEAFDETGVGFSTHDAAKETPVTLAVKGHHLKALRAMTVNRRFEAEGVDGNGDRPLHIAIRNRDELAAQLLLLNGVNPDARNREGLTPTHLAVLSGSDSILETLLNSGHPDLSIVDSEGRTALSRFLLTTTPMERVLTLARKLIDATKLAEDLNVRDHSGRTALIHAVQRGEADLVALLLERGARADIRDDTGRLASDYAKAAGRRDLVTLVSAPAEGPRHAAR